ncbi:unnamed protein product [Rhizophagus irregularis]|nr:unnamed protein product [Rhizophagus irregularis]
MKTVNTILSCLPTSSKQLLFDNNIKLPTTILSKSPLFNYISFCEFPNFEVVNKITGVALRYPDDDRINCFEREIYKLFVSQIMNVKVLIWQTSQPLTSFPGASTCFSQLNSLTINLNYVNSKSLYEMAQICKDLEFLEVRYCSYDLPGLISLIDAQKNLKKVQLYTMKGNCEELSKVLARKGNTINILYLNLISTIPPSFLVSLINLTQLSIYNDENHKFINPKVNVFQQHLAISEFPKLQSLSVMGLSCFKELAMLIDKTKGDITRIHIDTTNRIAQNTGMLIKAIAKNCPKIEKLNTYLEPKDFIHVKSLLTKCRQLEEITFDSLNIFVNDIGDELFDIFTKCSPMTLIDISISSSWKCSIEAFDLFFDSCKERTLLNFNIIYNSKDYITEKHRDIVRRYINEGVIRYSNCN